MNLPAILRRLTGLLLLGLVVLLSTGCFGDPPEQSGVFVTTNAGDSWQATPDLRAKGAKKPKVYPPLAVTAVGASQQNTDLVVAGTSDNLYRSTDGGKNWSLLTSNLPTAKKALAATGITFHPTQADTFYVYGVSAGYGKIFKSTNRGDQLRDIFTTPQPGLAVTSLVLDPANPDTVYAGDQLGSVYRSSDGGFSWRRLFSTEVAVTSLALSGGSIFVGTAGLGVLRSSDGGATFTPVTSGLSSEQLTVWRLLVGHGGLYAGTENGLLFTNSFGDTWRSVGNPLPAKGSRIQAVTISGSNAYFATNAVVYRMIPNGDSFVPVQLGLAKNVFSLASTPANASVLFAGANSEGVDFSQQYLTNRQGNFFGPQGIR